MDQHEPSGTPPADAHPNDPTEHRMPGWVKGFVAAAVVAVVIVVVAVVAGGDHGPSRHLPGGGDAEVQTPGGHTPPFDHG